MTQGHPILHNVRGRIFYAAIWLVASVIQATTIRLAGGFAPYGLLLLDSLLFNLLFAVGVISMWYPIRFNTQLSRRRYLSLFPYALIAILLIASWIVAGKQLMQLITAHPIYLAFLKSSTGWRIIQGSLLFTITLLFYSQQVHILQLSQKVNALQQTLEKEAAELTRITVKDRQHIHILTVPEIDFIEACGDYVQIHTAKSVFLKEKTMKFFEERLPSKQFIRIHRSFIVNISQIDRIELYEKERYRLFLKNGKIVKASDTGYKLLKESL